MKKTDKVTRKDIYDSSIDDIKFGKVGRIKLFFKKSFNSKFDDLKIRYKKDPKKKIALVLAIVGLFSTLVGSSYAYLTYVSKTNNSTVINAGSLALVFNETSNSIVLSGAVPEADDVGLANSNEYEFSIENTGSIPSTFRLTLDNVCSTTSSYTVNGTSVSPTVCVPNEYIKVAIKEGNKSYRVLEKKSIDGASYILDANSLNPGVVKTYKMKIWLDYNTPNTYSSSGSTVSVFAGKLGLSYEQGNKNLDKSGANMPKLDEDSMIPVYYDETNEVWKKADKNNSLEEYKWYDYDDKMWANSVTVSSTNRSTYLNADLGTTIPMDDILTMQVWIPRYKYKVWHYNESGYDGSWGGVGGIEVTFESGTNETGEIECQDTISGTEGDASEICKLKSTNATCTDSTCNNKTYTHPAFTFGDDELTGFWIGKFEISAPQDDACYTTPNETNCNKTGITPLVKPDVTSYRYASAGTFVANIMAMNDNNNIYGFNSTTDTHVIKNIEWGAAAYLANSDYGVFYRHGSITSVNESSKYYTGRSGSAEYGKYTYDGYLLVENTKMTKEVIGVVASTTRNIYGVYDMAGCAYDFTMGNSVSPDGSTMMSGCYSADLCSEFTGMNTNGGEFFPYTGKYTYPEDKYIDKYSYATSETRRYISKLGDGVKEVLAPSDDDVYGGYCAVVKQSQSWFKRGGYYGITGHTSPTYFAAIGSDYFGGSTSTHLVLSVLS